MHFVASYSLQFIRAAVLHCAGLKQPEWSIWWSGLGKTATKLKVIINPTSFVCLQCSPQVLHWKTCVILWLPSSSFTEFPAHSWRLGASQCLNYEEAGGAQIPSKIPEPHWKQYKLKFNLVACVLIISYLLKSINGTTFHLMQWLTNKLSS